MTEPRFRKYDLVDIVLRRAVVREVHDNGRLSLVHSDEEFESFDPDAVDVEIDVVGHITVGPLERHALDYGLFLIPREDA